MQKSQNLGNFPQNLAERTQNLTQILRNAHSSQNLEANLPTPIRYKLNASILAIGASEHKFSKSQNLAKNPQNLAQNPTTKSIILLDSAYHLYELRDGEFIFAKKIFDFEAQHQFAKSVALSQNGYVAIGEPHSPNCHILHIYNGILTHIKTLCWHKADIYNIRFSKNGKYLVSGGEDGKVFIFALPHFNLISILPPRPDYISNIHFGRTQNLVIYSSYDNVNAIFDMSTNKVISEFETNAVAEDMTFFDDDKKVFFICANGESGIYDIENNSLSLRQNYNAWLTRAGLTKDDNFAYIGARDGILRYLDLAQNRPAFEIALDNNGISTMRVVDARLYLGFASGHLEIFDLKKGEIEFENAINARDLRTAQSIASQNLPLKTHKNYIALKNSLWESAFKNAQNLLSEAPSKDNFAHALADLQIFFEDTEKKAAFDEFSANIGAIKDLREAIDVKDYALSYQLIATNPYLKETSEFERLENAYNSAFEDAKELLFNNDLDDKNKAIEILKPFQKVAHLRENINVLLRNAGKFREAELLFKNKQFGEFFKLAQNFRAIQTTANYKKTLAFGEQILATINEFEAKNKYKQALELLEVLAQFLPLQKVALERKNGILLKMEFLEIFAQKDFQKLYANLPKYSALKGLAEYVALQNRLNTIFEDALLNASNGECEAVYEALTPYFNAPHLQEKIEGVFNICYINEIDLALDSADAQNIAESGLDSANIDWFATLTQYISMFGKNDEFLKIIAKNEHISQICEQISIQNKKDAEFLRTIIVYKN